MVPWHFDPSEKSHDQKHVFKRGVFVWMETKKRLANSQEIWQVAFVIYRHLEIINFWQWSDSKWPIYSWLIKHYNWWKWKSFNISETVPDRVISTEIFGMAGYTQGRLSLCLVRSSGLLKLLFNICYYYATLILLFIILIWMISIHMCTWWDNSEKTHIQKLLYEKQFRIPIFYILH